MGVLAVNTLKPTLGGGYKPKERTRKSIRNAVHERTVGVGIRETEERSWKLKRDDERRKRRREQRRSDWRRNANPNYERSLSPGGREGRVPIDDCRPLRSSCVPGVVVFVRRTGTRSARLPRQVPPPFGSETV